MSSKLSSITRVFTIKTIIGLILWSIGLMILITLWQWQVDRLVWKNDLLRMIAQENAQQNLPLLTESTTKIRTPKRLFLKKFQVQTSETPIDPDQIIAVGPRPKDDVEGVHIYAPLPMKDTNINLMAHLGWVALDQKDDLKQILASMNWPSLINGYFVAADDPKIVKVKNFPAQNIWLRADLHDISTAFNLELLHKNELDTFTDSPSTPAIFFYVETALNEKVHPQLYKDISIRNNHAQYAQFWMTLAFLWCFIFMFAALRPVLKDAWVNFRNKNKK